MTHAVARWFLWRFLKGPPSNAGRIPRLSTPLPRKRLSRNERLPNFLLRNFKATNLLGKRRNGKAFLISWERLGGGRTRKATRQSYPLNLETLRIALWLACSSSTPLSNPLPGPHSPAPPGSHPKCQPTPQMCFPTQDRKTSCPYQVTVWHEMQHPTETQNTPLFHPRRNS